ncbi:WecB/TagA/CpsF family glycosyltransferase, partial [Oceanithermus sp.]
MVVRHGWAGWEADSARERDGSGVAGCAHGYFSEDEEAALVERVRASGANLLLAGLGPRQEVFLHQHKGRLGGAVGIGVGGTLDVLAGEARRAPAWARRLGVEWLLRVGLDPKRWPRAVRLVRFAWWVEREARRLPRQKT